MRSQRVTFAGITFSGILRTGTETLTVPTTTLQKILLSGKVVVEALYNHSDDCCSDNKVGKVDPVTVLAFLQDFGSDTIRYYDPKNKKIRFSPSRNQSFSIMELS